MKKECKIKANSKENISDEELIDMAERSIKEMKRLFFL